MDLVQTRVLFCSNSCIRYFVLASGSNNKSSSFIGIFYPDLFVEIEFLTNYVVNFKFLDRSTPRFIFCLIFEIIDFKFKLLLFTFLKFLIIAEERAETLLMTTIKGN